ncbi:MAG: hemerythrin family protein [Spirochaetales bacterium]|nr:hemerythrin family protein [Spirochaetales bacterium]
MLVQCDAEKNSVDIESIDNHHKELFIILNKLNGLVEQNDENWEKKQQDAVLIIKNLFNYSNYHFLNEEELFIKYSYPETDIHVKKHDRFRKIIKDYLIDIKTATNLSLDYLQDFLVEWILEHIQVEDHKYALYFSRNKIVPELHISEKGRERNDILLLWEKKKLSLEIKEIDDQHKELVRILQQTKDLQYTSENRKQIFGPLIVKKLYHYASFHFSYEEEFMAKNKYEAIDEHREWHKVFVADINRLNEEYENASGVLTEEIVFYLRDWIVDHILKEDKKYKDDIIARN